MIPKKLIFALLLGTFLLDEACNKLKPLNTEPKICEIPDQLCDSAKLVVGNKTTDTIYFNKGENGTGVQYYLAVMPGKTTTFNTDGIDVRFNSDSTTNHFSGPIQGLQIPSMYFSVKMNRCIKKVYFIKNSVNSIDLDIMDKD